MNDALLKAIEAIEKIAPEAWAQMVAYQRTDAAIGMWTAVAFVVIFIGATVGVSRELIRQHKTRPSFEVSIELGFLLMICIVIAAGSALAIGDYYAIMNHPEGYLIKSILSSVK